MLWISWAVYPQFVVDLVALVVIADAVVVACLLYTSPSPRDILVSRMPSSA